jgi:FtsP/CotA-like multicopper oxidase with cupredoxin domain
MLKLSGMAAGSALLPASAQQPAQADYTIRIAPIRLEIAPGQTVKTTAFNGRVPGELIRLQEGKTVAIDVINDTDVPDIVHWHGLQIPASEDGASEEGSPVSAPHGGRQRYVFTAKPAGFRWYHSHIYAGHNLNRSMYSGRYDRESFLALHDWNGYINGASDGYQEVAYNHATINDRTLGFGEPIRVRQQERILFHILNASATLMHTVALPGHKFLVVALDGNPVPSPRLVDTLRLGPAERVDAIVVMDHPGVWVLGEMDDAIRKSGMGIVIEYAGRSGESQWSAPANVDFRYELFGGSASDAVADQARHEQAPEDGDEVSISLAFRPKFKGYGDFDHWTINGVSWPQTSPVQLHEGARYRLVLDNQSDDIHPVHLHRHTFEVKQINGMHTQGILKDVLLLPTRAKTEVVFTANNPGKTLFHCHQQDHMDSGFMMLFEYAATNETR